MHNGIAAYAGKGKHYVGTSSLITRFLIAAGVHLVGYHHFWISCFNLLEVTIPYQLHSHLISLDKEKLICYYRDHDFQNKAKRKRSEHKKFTKKYVAYQKDVAQIRLTSRVLDAPTKRQHQRRQQTRVCMESLDARVRRSIRQSRASTVLTMLPKGTVYRLLKH